MNITSQSQQTIRCFNFSLDHLLAVIGDLVPRGVHAKDCGILSQSFLKTSQTLCAIATLADVEESEGVVDSKRGGEDF
jgi:hypothetical protein